MLQLPTREQSVRRDQRIHHRFIGGPILAEVLAFELDNLEAFKTWRFLGEAAIFVDGERDALLPEVRDPDVEVVGAVPRRRVHKTCARVVSDVITSEEWDVEVVTAAAEWVRAH